MRMVVDHEQAPDNISRVEQLILEHYRINIQDISTELSWYWCISSLQSIIYE